MPTRSARKSYRSHGKKSQCKSIKRGTVCKRTTGCKMTRKTEKKQSYCRKSKNVMRNKRSSFKMLNLVNPRQSSLTKEESKKSKSSSFMLF